MFQQSTLTFGSAKTHIAEQAGKQQTTEMLARAGRSLQFAIKQWNTVNWSWLLSTAQLTLGTAGTAALPYDFRDVYSLTWLGQTQRWIPARTRRAYDRLYQSQASTAYAQTRYDTFLRGALGILSVSGTSVSGTASLSYYRKMTEPCAVTASSCIITATGQPYVLSTSLGAFSGARPGNRVTFSTGFTTASLILATAISQGWDPASANGYADILYVNASSTAATASTTVTIGGDSYYLDIPQDYEGGILGLAAWHFMAGVGGPADKIAEFKELASSVLQEALNDDGSNEDLDICFEPPLPNDTRAAWNPNRTWE